MVPNLYRHYAAIVTGEMTTAPKLVLRWKQHQKVQFTIWNTKVKRAKTEVLHEETCENSMCWDIKEIHSPATLLGTPCEYQVGPPFTLRTALIHCGIDTTRCWKHFVPYWHDGITELMQICQLHISDENFLVCHIPNVLGVEVTGVQWSKTHQTREWLSNLFLVSVCEL